MVAPRADHVIFVHGLWMPGGESTWLRRRLANSFGFTPHVFRYATTSDSIERVTERLNDYACSLDAERVHFVGHSLGGLVLLNLFERFPEQPPGRVVLLGSPVRGSLAARKLTSAPLAQRLTRRMVGRHTASLLLADDASRCWSCSREIGVVVGTRSMGLGRWVARFAEPNDGTVAMRETELEGESDRVVLPVSHLGMLLSPQVVAQTARFLRDGHFDKL